MADQAGGILPDIERNEETRPLLAELARLIRDRKSPELYELFGSNAEEKIEDFFWCRDWGEFRQKWSTPVEEESIHEAAGELIEALRNLQHVTLFDPQADPLRGKVLRLLHIIKLYYPEALGLKRGTAPDPNKPDCLRTWAALPEDERQAHAAKKRFAQNWIHQTRTRTNERTITNWLAQWEKERQS